jgi:hypothetical protein
MCGTVVLLHCYLPVTRSDHYHHMLQSVNCVHLSTYTTEHQLETLLFLEL